MSITRRTLAFGAAALALLPGARPAFGQESFHPKNERPPVERWSNPPEYTPVPVKPIPIPKRALKKLLLAGVAALSVLSTSVAYAADESDPPPPRFRPWQQAWQCNDIRVTVTARDPFSVEYDLGGTIWGGSRFTIVKGALYFNGRPCLPLQPVGY
jgi:hypothetical protein